MCNDASLRLSVTGSPALHAQPRFTNKNTNTFIHQSQLFTIARIQQATFSTTSGPFFLPPHKLG